MTLRREDLDDGVTVLTMDRTVLTMDRTVLTMDRPGFAP